MTVSFRPGLTAGSLFFMISAAFVTSWAGQPRSAAASPPEMDWPAVSKQCRPWTYWWWLGSAVSRSELTRHLTAYHQAGMGGVHIVPIYGAEGYQDRYINYLTPKWMEMLAHTVTEANRLGMGVDMTSGTGWPFGGPWVGPEHAAARVFFQTYDLGPGQRLDQPIRSKKQPAAALQALMAFGGTDEPVELTDKVDPDGRLDWSPPAGGDEDVMSALAALGL